MVVAVNFKAHLITVHSANVGKETFFFTHLRLFMVCKCVCDKIKIRCLTVFLRELVTCVSLRYGSFFLMLKKMYMEFKLVGYFDEIF